MSPAARTGHPLRLGLALLSLWVQAGPALAHCTLGRLAQLAVTMNGLRPVVAAQINGADALFIADSGAFYSMLAPSSAAQFKLRLLPAPYNFHINGIGGSAEVQLTRVDRFALADIPFPHAEFIVGGTEPGGGAAGLLGQNVLGIADVEYDLANGVIRLMRANDCRQSPLAYWAGSQPYSVIDIAWATPAVPYTTANAFINGVKTRVMFDTGAATSMLSLRAAARAGVEVGADGVRAAGSFHGVGRQTIPTWIGPFSSFRIGDEEIRNTRLRIGDIGIAEADMLIGADFFLSHRIYVASSQHKLYFTYNGGPVFNLNAVPPPEAPHEAPNGPPNGSPPEVASSPAPPERAPASDASGEAGTPDDAAGFSRRGAAFAARRDFEHALTDFTRACELAPDVAVYFYQRAILRLDYHQPVLAMADLDRALELQPQQIGALLARATLRLAAGDTAGAAADLDAAREFAPHEADLRFMLGGLYVRAGRYASAIAQYDLWVGAHAQDARLGEALGGRCRARALLDQQLDRALSDCNAAHRLSPNGASILDSRALVRLRRGEFAQSIADYDAALRLQPRSAWALYGRGVDKLRRGMTSEGAADIAAAQALQPLIADEAGKLGITP